MARKQKAGGGGGAPEWLVTFADLMSLLVCFFVLIISFSNQDEQKLSIVAGSMRDAFGSQTEVRRSGLIEIDGKPESPFFRDVSMDAKEGETDFASENDRSDPKQGPEADTHDIEKLDSETKDQYLMAAASLRQALQDLPDVAELSRNIVLHVDDEGIHIELVDQDGRSMFPDNSREPYQHTRAVLKKIAPVIHQMPNRITISGHTTYFSPLSEPRYSHWELSADRAEEVRKILSENGISGQRIAGVVGKGDTEPMFINDPQLSANRRVTILLMHEPPPLPADIKP